MSCGAHAPPGAAGAAAERAARSAADAGWSDLEAESGPLGQSSSLGDSGAGEHSDDDNMSSDGLSALADGGSSHSGSGDDSDAGSDGDEDEEVGEGGSGAGGSASESASGSEAGDMGSIDADAQAGGSGSKGDGVSDGRTAGLAGCSALGRDSRGEGGQGGPGDGQRSRGARAGALRGPARRGAAAGVDAGTEAGAPVARPAAVGAYVPPAARAPGAHLRARRPAPPPLADGPQCKPCWVLLALRATRGVALLLTLACDPAMLRLCSHERSFDNLSLALWAGTALFRPSKLAAKTAF